MEALEALEPLSLTPKNTETLKAFKTSLST